jgi:carbamoyl-phosphate synthase large subunit
VILGGGPNRIGQGIEFDYCCVHAGLRAPGGRLRDRHGQLQPGDRLDRLRHLRPYCSSSRSPRGRTEHLRPQRADGVIVQFGGQTPLKLASPRAAGCPSSAPRRTIDRPRTVSASSALLERSASRQPADGTPERSTRPSRGRTADRLSGPRPAKLRPRRPRHGDRLRRTEPAPFLQPRRSMASPGRPLLVIDYPRRRIRGMTSTQWPTASAHVIGGIMQHIEEAGSTPATPPARSRRPRAAPRDVDEIERHQRRLAARAQRPRRD